MFKKKLEKLSKHKNIKQTPVETRREFIKF